MSVGECVISERGERKMPLRTGILETARTTGGLSILNVAALKSFQFLRYIVSFLHRFEPDILAFG